VDHPLLISYIVPVLDEGPNIVPLYERLRRVFAELGYDYELIFVDDGSSDDTERRILDVRAGDERVKLVKLSNNFGQQCALAAGYDHATGAAVVSLDGDLQHPPELIPHLIRHWEQGVPIVYTVRRTTAGIDAFKALTARLFYGLLNLVSDVRIEPCSCDFRLLDRRVVAALREIRSSRPFFRLMIQWIGFKQRAVEFDADVRHAGTTKYSLAKMLSFSLDGFFTCSPVPLKVVLSTTACASMALLFLVAYFVFGGASGLHEPFGGAAYLALFFAVISLQCLGTAILCLYLLATYRGVRQRPAYVVDHTEGLDP